MRNLPFLLLIFLLSSCAGKYSELLPKKVQYDIAAEGEDMTIQYKYDMTRLRGNKKIAKRAESKGIKIVAAKVTNHSDRPLVFGEDVKLYTDNRELLVMSPVEMYNSLKQNAPIYLLYLLLAPVRLEFSNNGRTEVTPVGFIVGPILALINVSVAASANNDMKKEFESQYLMGKTIPPGESMYGLIGLRQVEYFPLSVKLVGKE